jgi:hypothetical protein
VDAASALLDRALELIDSLGLDGLRPRALNLRERAATAVVGEPPQTTTEAENVFRLEGDRWRIAYGDVVVVLKDSKGLRDVARLLSRPGRDFHVSDLMAATEGVTADPVSEPLRRMTAQQLADQGLAVGAPGGEEALDAQARRRYRDRVNELQEEIEAAESDGDLARAARAREERDLIASELAAAYGLGDRPRRSGDPAERARKAVTWRIRQAITRVGQAHPILGRHLDRSIRTGTFCCYAPDERTGWST